MKIKSMLLGSAAAMVAVSGAQAAEAIVVEPEPVEYVRVCEMYGVRWF
ncbi:MAG: porin, partial [Nitratireductor sp.]|nr:porin [Nitratireductor sp.]